jgi:hypothetical protein
MARTKLTSLRRFPTAQALRLGGGSKPPVTEHQIQDQDEEKKTADTDTAAVPVTRISEAAASQQEDDQHNYDDRSHNSRLSLGRRVIKDYHSNPRSPTGCAHASDFRVTILVFALHRRSAARGAGEAVGRFLSAAKARGCPLSCGGAQLEPVITEGMSRPRSISSPIGYLMMEESEKNDYRNRNP